MVRIADPFSIFYGIDRAGPVSGHDKNGYRIISILIDQETSHNLDLIGVFRNRYSILLTTQEFKDEKVRKLKEFSSTSNPNHTVFWNLFLEKNELFVLILMACCKWGINNRHEMTVYEQREYEKVYDRYHDQIQNLEKLMDICLYSTRRKECGELKKVTLEFEKGDPMIFERIEGYKYPIFQILAWFFHGLHTHDKSISEIWPTENPMDDGLFEDEHKLFLYKFVVFFKVESEKEGFKNLSRRGFFGLYYYIMKVIGGYRTVDIPEQNEPSEKAVMKRFDQWYDKGKKMDGEKSIVFSNCNYL